ncbi:MAG TPA: prepilin-type N-terminal cleavage/methylation domain-containing protein [Burkholderiales bacterium]|nr:prepilin-type N-terminal cleavage/methylation domain-containing protein [Burkholderiales bacterium]
MRLARPDRPPVALRGVTLIELVVSLVVLAILTALVVYFIYPVRQAVDVAMRAELTDIADHALQRISREVRLALPNSVRVTASGGAQFLEFLPVVTAGRYRAEGGGVSGGTDCPDTGAGQPASDQLTFGIADTCFKSLGPLLNGAAITTNDFVVVNNYGAGFADQDAYLDTTSNRRRIQATAVEAGPDRQRLVIAAGTFDAGLHDSPGKRFYVVTGNGATLLPVTYECTAGGILLRRSGYPRTQAQPTSFSSGVAQRLASRITACAFEYSASVVAPQVGLLTLRLTLSAPRSDGGSESVSLYQSVHVVNVP